MGIVDGVRQRRALMAAVSWRGLVPNVYTVHAGDKCQSDGDDGHGRECGYQSDVTGTWAWMLSVLVQSPVCR